MRTLCKETQFSTSSRAGIFLAAISLLTGLAACFDSNVEKDVLTLSDKSINSSIPASGQSLLLVRFPGDYFSISCILLYKSSTIDNEIEFIVVSAQHGRSSVYIASPIQSTFALAFRRLNSLIPSFRIIAACPCVQANCSGRNSMHPGVGTARYSAKIYQEERFLHLIQFDSKQASFGSKRMTCLAQHCDGSSPPCKVIC